jgi:hypothetical protein
MDWMIKEMKFDSQQGQEIFPFSTASTLALMLIQLPIQWVPEVMQLGCETNLSHCIVLTFRVCGVIPPLCLHNDTILYLGFGLKWM